MWCVHHCFFVIKAAKRALRCECIYRKRVLPNDGVTPGVEELSLLCRYEEARASVRGGTLHSEVVPTVVHADRSAFVHEAVCSVRVVIVRLERRAPDSWPRRRTRARSIVLQ